MRLEIEQIDRGGAGPASDLPPVRVELRRRRRGSTGSSSECSWRSPRCRCGCWRSTYGRSRRRARVDRDRRRLHRRPDAVPGLDPGRLAPPAGREPVRAALDAGRLLPAGGRDLRRAHRARDGAVAVAAAVEAGRGARLLLCRAGVSRDAAWPACGRAGRCSCWPCSSARFTYFYGSWSVLGDLFPGVPDLGLSVRR